MEKTIWLNDTESRKVYVSYEDDEECWNCERCIDGTQRVADYLRAQGYHIIQVVNEDGEHYIKVNRLVHDLNGVSYKRNQCDGDIFEWFNNALIGDFTYYFDKLIFNTEDGFVAAYRDNINNNIKI